MDLFELKEDELSKYIDSTLQNDPQYQRFKGKGTAARNYSTSLSKTISSCEKYVHEMQRANELIKSGDMDSAYRCCLKTAEAMRHTSNQLSSLPIKYGYFPNNSSRSDDPEIEMKATFEYQDNGIIHVILPELLPKRLKYNATTGTYENRDAQAAFKKRYQKSFYDEYLYGKHRIYTSKVFLFIINYFEEKSLLQDHDNFDAKAFQDLLTSLYLLDDNADYCAIASDSQIGPNHTEAYIVPHELFPNFLKEFYI